MTRSNLMKAFVLVFVFVFIAAAAHSQGVAINGTGAPADTSAILDLASINKGFLPPRMSSIQRGAIVLPATGLVVYQTDGISGLYWNAGTPAAPNWKLVGQGGAAGGQWSVSGSDLYFLGGSVGIGTLPLAYRLAVTGDLQGLRVQTNTAGGRLASFGGIGNFEVDAPGVIAGRLSLLEDGRMGLGVAAPAARLDVLGGNWDVVNGEGDLRIGNATTRLKFGVATLGAGQGAATIMQQGPAGAYNVLALGAQGNKVLNVVGATQRVGIGTDAPSAPLGFPATVGKKVTLYPGVGGDYGLGISGGRLQLTTDPGAADVAMGVDNNGSFSERFAFKNTGALAVNGNAGSAGQVLQSNGAGAAATWVSPTSTQYNGLYQAISSSYVLLNNSNTVADVPGLSQTFFAPRASRVLVSFAAPVQGEYCTLCALGLVSVRLVLDGTEIQTWHKTAFGGSIDLLSATYLINVPEGFHTATLRAYWSAGYDPNLGIYVGGTATAFGSLTVQVVPQ
jgi:hypothetical protein